MKCILRTQVVNCYSEYTKAAEDLVGAKEFFAESSGAGGDAEMKEMAREEVRSFFASKSDRGDLCPTSLSTTLVFTHVCVGLHSRAAVVVAQRVAKEVADQKGHARIVRGQDSSRVIG